MNLMLLKPHISEKATDLASNYNRYVFRVLQSANKIDIKRAVESLYGVNVVSVHIVNIRSKPRRLGRIVGSTPGYKKAIVGLKSGQRIDILPQ
ncbi:50S ribosomal protein L23 [Candidatus Parcubacteria bacterium]|nr:MAG: 50S ribosomal protein L23 [Candidatus Parcubacteria bacterium]